MATYGYIRTGRDKEREESTWFRPVFCVGPVALALSVRFCPYRNRPVSGAAGTGQDHDEGSAHGAGGTSPTETPVVALAVSSGQAHNRPGDRADNFR